MNELEPQPGAEGSFPPPFSPPGFGPPEFPKKVKLPNPNRKESKNFPKIPKTPPESASSVFSPEKPLDDSYIIREKGQPVAETPEEIEKRIADLIRDLKLLLSRLERLSYEIFKTRGYESQTNPTWPEKNTYNRREKDNPFVNKKSIESNTNTPLPEGNDPSPTSIT